MSSGPGTRLGTINPISLMQFEQIHTLKRHKSGSSIKRNVCMLGHLSTPVQLDAYTMLYDAHRATGFNYAMRPWVADYRLVASPPKNETMLTVTGAVGLGNRNRGQGGLAGFGV